MNLNSRRKLQPKDAERFADAGPPLFSDLAKVVCSTGMLPQKELHECWQMAEAVHRTFPEARQIADIAAGHGLLAWILVLMARASSTPVLRTGVAVDIQRPRSAAVLASAITARWPDLAGTVHYVEGSVEAVVAGKGPETLLVAAHACGSLSDRVLIAALASGSPVAIMPCCHSLRKQTQTLEHLARVSDRPLPVPDPDRVLSSAPGPAAMIDAFRIEALTAAGYDVMEASIQPEITAFHRILMGRPGAAFDQTREVWPHALDTGMQRGERRAYETLAYLDVTDIETAETLARRPSRAWQRWFDLSYWVEDQTAGQQLASRLEDLNQGRAQVSLQDRYQDPRTGRLSLTHRVALRSTETPITKEDVALIRQEFCEALHDRAHGRWEWRGR